jgi:hypothetical protein
MACSLNFGADSSFTIDEQTVVQGSDQFGMVQTLWIDTSMTDAILLVSVTKSGQTLVVKGRTQGYYPVAAPNAWQLTFTCLDALAVVPLVLCNYQVAPGVWAATHP